MLQKVSRTHDVPEFIHQAHAELQKQKTAAVAPAQEKVTRPDCIPFRTAQKTMNLIDHGRGIFEDSKTGSVWYRDGKFLRCQAPDRDRIVTEHLESIKNK
jgi:hypothetical protein